MKLRVSDEFKRGNHSFFIHFFLGRVGRKFMWEGIITFVNSFFFPILIYFMSKAEIINYF